MKTNPHTPPVHGVTAEVAERWLRNRYPRQEQGISDAVNNALARGVAAFGAYRLTQAAGSRLVISLGRPADVGTAEKVPPRMLEAAKRARLWVTQVRARDLAATAVPALTRAVTAYRSGAAARLEYEEAAWLLVILSRTQPRNHAWHLMDPGHAPAHIALWTDLTRLAPDGLAADPAALLAFTALQAGATDTADAGIRRALADNPRHKITRLLASAREARLPADAYQPPPTPRTDPAGTLKLILGPRRAGAGPALEEPDM